jgi:hypothetical protein
MKNDPSKNWWWNKLDRTDERFQLYDAAAFHYELARRNFPLKDYPLFTKLKRGELDIVHARFSQKFAGWKPPVAMFHHGKTVLPEGYAMFESVSWNLNASRHALQKEFWNLIAQERIQRGIAEPINGKDGGASRNAGNKNKNKGKGGQPWRWLELLDNPHGLTSNERSHLSAARSRRDELKNDFILLWKEIEQHRAFLEHFYKENPQALQIHREPVKW